MEQDTRKSRLDRMEHSLPEEEIIEKEEEIVEEKPIEGKKKHKKKNVKRTVIAGVIILIAVLAAVFMLKKPISDILEKVSDSTYTRYLAGDTNEISLMTENREDITLFRGIEVKVLKETIEIKDKTYRLIEYEGKKYYVLESNLVEKKEDVVTEKELYVRTSATLYESTDSSKIKGFIKKGSKIEILGYDTVLADGKVSKYKVKYNDQEGYIRGKYLVLSEEEALEVYDPEGSFLVHQKISSSQGAGDAATLDYFPVDKPKFEDNVMPDEVRALYINSSAIRNIDKYIAFAKENNINAFVVDIKDNTSPAYASPVMEKYSPTNYNKAFSSFENYKGYIKKLKDEGFYVIGRITVFKDSYYITDHPEHAIMDARTKQPFKHNGSFWPSAFNRPVWEFNVELAKEAVIEMGFNEIQFDYVRFPDRTQSLEKSGQLDFNNKYNETKAQAIQSFLMYAADELHDVGAYISVDVFGESVHNYVTGYGQYWPAISNVVDVISGMPYPDHFNPYEYGFKQVVWTIPYDLLKKWGSYVVEKQELIPTPAVVRTWIQAYDTGKSPAVKYDATKIKEQIRGLYANGLTGGWMTWNSGSNLAKYEQIKEAFKEDYTR